MRAILADSGPRFDAAYPDPVANGREALIRVRLAGVCNTDLELLKGYMDYRGILGHEFVGEVVQAEDSAWIGKRVVGDINAACYECETCLAGRHTHCPNRTTLGIYARDGAFADYLLLPQANLYAVPDEVSDDKAAFAMQPGMLQNRWDLNASSRNWTALSALFWRRRPTESSRPGREDSSPRAPLSTRSVWRDSRSLLRG
jgi:threonine dehydrogenase-like Zn-dependent dehydrogenase